MLVNMHLWSQDGETDSCACAAPVKKLVKTMRKGKAPPVDSFFPNAANCSVHAGPDGVYYGKPSWFSTPRTLSRADERATHQTRR